MSLIDEARLPSLESKDNARLPSLKDKLTDKNETKKPELKVAVKQPKQRKKK